MPTPPGSFSCRPPSGRTAREGLQGKHVSDKEHQIKPKTPRTMMKKVNIVMKATHAWTQEDEERLTARLVDNFYDLINRSEEDGLYWTASQCDLIELAHIVWTSGALMDRRAARWTSRPSYTTSAGCCTYTSRATRRRSSLPCGRGRMSGSDRCGNGICSWSPRRTYRIPCGWR